MKKKPTYQPLLTFDLGTFLLALPLAFLLVLALGGLKLLVRGKRDGLEAVPENAILYGTHRDVISACVSPSPDPMTIVVGYHAFLAYLYIPWDRLVGLSHLCYRRVSDVPPLTQLLEMLKKFSGHRFWIFTDSGGPYGRVRKSLVILAKESGRPVVATSVTSDRYFKILNHRIPLPGARVTMRFGAPISHETLSALSSDEARDLLQSRLGALDQ